jgi:hybrid cluster-associated redox disulfide protein
MTPRNTDIDLESSVDEIMTAFPMTIAVFLRRRMSCIGCLMGPFHTVADAAKEYGIDARELLDELQRAARASSPPRSEPARADP